MSKIAHPYTCDGPQCGRIKGEGNGWLLGVVISDQQRLRLPTERDPQAMESPQVEGYAIVRWNEEVASWPNPNVHHLCSDACALKKQNGYARR